MAQLKIIQPESPRPAGRSRRASLAWGVFLRLYRLGIVVAIAWIIHRHHARLRIDGDNPITLAEVQSLFPRAARLGADSSERMGLWVLDRTGNAIGYVLRTSPMSDKIVGYSGPTDTLVALTPDKSNPVVVGIKVRSSSDTKQHVADVKADEGFMGTWNGKGWDEIAGTDPRSAGIEGVSGASLTSMCIANGIRRRFQTSSSSGSPATTRPQIHGRDVGILAVILVALAFSFTRLRGNLWLRRAFQVVLIGYVGFYSGQMIAQSLLAGWASTAIPWQSATGLVLLAAAALLVPWGSRRQLYCSHVCPHGAAQELVGRVRHRWMKRPPSIPHGLAGGLRWLPAALVVLVLYVTMQNVPLNLAGIEPFDAYLVRNAGAATITVAVVGLIAAAFVPMAYCKYGCPTGLVLSFLRSHGKADRFGRRDVAAAFILLLVVVLYTWHYPIRHFTTGIT